MHIALEFLIYCKYLQIYRRSNTVLGQQGGGGVVARAKVRTVKVKIFFLIDLVMTSESVCFSDLMKSFILQIFFIFTNN